MRNPVLNAYIQTLGKTLKIPTFVILDFHFPRLVRSADQEETVNKLEAALNL